MNSGIVKAHFYPTIQSFKSNRSGIRNDKFPKLQYKKQSIIFSNVLVKDFSQVGICVKFQCSTNSSSLASPFELESLYNEMNVQTNVKWVKLKGNDLSLTLKVEAIATIKMANVNAIMSFVVNGELNTSVSTLGLSIPTLRIIIEQLDDKAEEYDEVAEANDEENEEDEDDDDELDQAFHLVFENNEMEKKKKKNKKNERVVEQVETTITEIPIELKTYENASPITILCNVFSLPSDAKEKFWEVIESGDTPTWMCKGKLVLWNMELKLVMRNKRILIELSLNTVTGKANITMMNGNSLIYKLSYKIEKQEEISRISGGR